MRGVLGARDRGKRLADAALRMDGWFKWVKSGAVAPDQPGHVVGTPYGIKSEWDHTRTDRTDEPWEDHELKRNDFATWMQGGPPPSPVAYMNCWEAVLFSAYRAGLTTREQLQTIHRKAALAYHLGHARNNWDVRQALPSFARRQLARHRETADEKVPGASERYGRALSHAFQFYSSVPFEPEAGLVPAMGEILFWDRDNHVAISLGRTWVNGVAKDYIMSHWRHPYDGFNRITLKDLRSDMPTRFRFRPCPF
jgi:hypothetical protein